MSGLRSRLIAVALSLGVMACSTADGTRGGGVADAGQRLQALTDLDRRVSDIAWRLATANVDLCPARAASAGWTLHAAAQYSADLRPLAETRHGLSGDLPGVMSVGTDSPAARAGLGDGDLIVAIAGRSLDPGTDGPPRFEGLAANIVLLDQALDDGPTTVSVRRGDAVRDVRIAPVVACDYRFQVDPGDDYDARADGRGVFISSRLAAFASDEGDLAFVLAHEMAHNVLQHQPPRDARGRALPRLTEGLPPGDRAVAERDADRVGLYLMARSGVDIAQPARFLRRFAEADWRIRYAQVGHPSAGDRAVALDAVRAEIEVKRAAGQALVP